MIAQSVKCLPLKHEDPGLIPRTHIKKPGMEAFTVEVERDQIPGAHWPAHLHYSATQQAPGNEISIKKKRLTT